MASLQQKGNGWYCQFLFRGKRHAFSLGPVSQDDAKAKQVDYLLLYLKKRYAILPPGMDIVEYVQFDGKPAPSANDDEPLDGKLTVIQLRDKYVASHEASLEPSTIYRMKSRRSRRWPRSSGR
jgi:hypothetical protein